MEFSAESDFQREKMYEKSAAGAKLGVRNGPLNCFILFSSGLLKSQRITSHPFLYRFYVLTNFLLS
jgi:hypothetical protein